MNTLDNALDECACNLTTYYYRTRQPEKPREYRQLSKTYQLESKYNIISITLESLILRRPTIPIHTQKRSKHWLLVWRD
jgi:hypothetical protein